MATAIDVLSFIHQRYTTTGLMQRQKLLYYSQAWHSVWFGRALFSDPILAWKMGPVTPTAWKQDKEWRTTPDTDVRLTATEIATIEAVFDYYGKFNGTQLSQMTHDETPWKDSYLDVSPLMRGEVEILPRQLRTFYSVRSIEGQAGPVKPALPAEGISDAELDPVIDFELDRWSDLLDILADR